MDREIGKKLIDRLKTDRSIALLGPRQAGKSYLLKNIIEDIGGKYILLDDAILRDEIALDPVAYLRRQYESSKFLFIDEAAKLPSIFEAIKILIDEKEAKPSGICLANSGNYLLMERIKESLAGRVSLLTLYPLSWRECVGSNNDIGLFKLNPKIKEKDMSVKSFLQIDRGRTERLLWGGYPFSVISSDVDTKKRWAEDYLKTYVFPLVLEQFKVRDFGAFEKCARLLFIESGQFLNCNLLAQEIGVSHQTVVNYIHHIKAMMLFVSLEGYFRNHKKRLIKQPKIHIVDPILLHFAFGTNFSLEIARERKVLGQIYESFICFEIIKTLENAGKLYNIYSWRTADKAEVDIVLELDGEIIPFEIKMSKKLNSGDARGIRSFLEDNRDVKHGYVIYPGREIINLAPNVTAIPDWFLLGAF